MNRELFSDAMNEIDSKYVEEALTYKPAKRFVFPVWAQRCVAACLICVLGLRGAGSQPGGPGGDTAVD